MVLSCAGLFIVLGSVVQSFVYLTYFMNITIQHAERSGSVGRVLDCGWKGC